VLTTDVREPGIFGDPTDSRYTILVLTDRR